MIWKAYENVTWESIEPRPYAEFKHFEGTAFSNGFCESKGAQVMIKGQFREEPGNPETR